MTVPRPERYAIHKLILAAQRDDDAVKSAKDIAQAESLIKALSAKRSFELVRHGRRLGKWGRSGDES